MRQTLVRLRFDVDTFEPQSFGIRFFFKDSLSNSKNGMIELIIYDVVIPYLAHANVTR